MIFNTTYAKSIEKHYEKGWGIAGRKINFSDGPIKDLPRHFSILEFEPHEGRDMWTYATCCMSQPGDEQPIELHIFSPEKSGTPVEILVAVAHYHRTREALRDGHSVNFGKPWFKDSRCEYGVVSLPYLDGPALEKCEMNSEKTVRFLWLIPITKEERDYKKDRGLSALEDKFEEKNFNYLDPNRNSVC